MSGIFNIPLGNLWTATTAGTNAGATATKVAATGAIHHVLWATFYSDKDSLLQIKDGSTVIWESNLNISEAGEHIHVTFPQGALFNTKSAALSAVVASSTADCRVSVGGYSLGAQ